MEMERELRVKRGGKKNSRLACAEYLDLVISNRHKSIEVQLHFLSALQTDQ